MPSVRRPFSTLALPSTDSPRCRRPVALTITKLGTSIRTNYFQFVPSLSALLTLLLTTFSSYRAILWITFGLSAIRLMGMLWVRFIPSFLPLLVDFPQSVFLRFDVFSPSL